MRKQKEKNRNKKINTLKLADHVFISYYNVSTKIEYGRRHFETFLNHQSLLTKLDNLMRMNETMTILMTTESMRATSGNIHSCESRVSVEPVLVSGLVLERFSFFTVSLMPVLFLISETGK